MRKQTSRGCLAQSLMLSLFSGIIVVYWSCPCAYFTWIPAFETPTWYNWASQLSRPTKGYWRFASCPPKNLCYGIPPYSLGQVSLVPDTIVFICKLFSRHQSTCTLTRVSYDRIIELDPNAKTKFFHFRITFSFSLLGFKLKHMGEIRYSASSANFLQGPPLTRLQSCIIAASQ